MTDAEFDQISGKLMSGTTALPKAGLINVNTASEIVLSGVPGIGVDMASSLIAARAGRVETGAGWVRDTLKDDTRLNQAAPYLTAQTAQWSADVAAVGRHGRGYRRARFVIDSSTGTPRVIYRRDLSPLGWALGAQVRQTLASKKEMR
jgi:hypothetical protein